jgi:hypothetical protein
MELKGLMFQKDNLPSYKAINGFFDDNGDEPDGNSWLMPYNNFEGKSLPDGTIVCTIKKVKYTGAKSQFKGKKWTGFSSRNEAFVLVKRPKK